MKITLPRIMLAAALLVIFILRFVEVMRALFIAFLATLFAIFLLTSAQGLSGKRRISEKVGISLILLVLFGGGAVTGIYAGDALASQLDQLIPKVTSSIERTTTYLQQYGWGREVLASVKETNLSAALPRIGDLFLGFITGIAIFLVVLIAGAFIALDPRTYKRGLIWLAPEGKDQQFADTLHDLKERLYRWTVGRLASMAVIFVLTLIGLLIVQSPLAVLLALIAGLFSFIPNFGPIISTALAVIVGLNVSTQLALGILLVFLIVQLLESNLITPLIERRAVYLPAGFILLAQTFMGLAFGILGLIVATPLAVAIITIMKRYRKATETQ